MKKFLVLMAALALVFAFVACGDDDDPAPASSSSQTSSVASTGSSNSTASSTSSTAASYTYGTINLAKYTTTNYDFDGGVAAARTAINAATVDLTGTTLTGIVTYQETGNAGKRFFIQDKNAGVYFYLGTAVTTVPSIGDKISIAVTQGKTYSSQKEITAVSGDVTVISSNNPVYYKTSTYSAADAGSVFRVNGSIASTTTKVFSTGADQAYYFRSFTAGAAWADGAAGVFIGPVDVYNTTIQMYVTSTDQFGIN